MARVLIVDDEPTLLELLGRYLERRGHSVSTASTAEEALERVRARDLDLVIADLTLPGADGEELIEALRQTNPELAGIVASGYPHVPRLAGVSFLQKPFLPQMLADEMARLLKR